MKNYIILTITALFFISCTEEVVINELKNASDLRLVIEANIDIDKNNTTDISTQIIKISNTTSFYNSDFLGVKGASINVTDKNGNSVGTFLDINSGVVDDIEDGIYTAIDFKTPIVGENYFINITVNGETYTAQDTYTSIVDINEITQEVLEAFDDAIQININIDNEIDVDNFYLSEIKNPNFLIPEFDNGSDEFISNTPGENNLDFVYFDEDLKKDDPLTIKLYGVSERYNNYLSKLLSLAGDSGGPFSTAPATIRGNLLNTTNQDNYALGYFSLNQFVEQNYTVE